MSEKTGHKKTEEWNRIESYTDDSGFVFEFPREVSVHFQIYNGLYDKDPLSCCTMKLFQEGNRKEILSIATKEDQIRPVVGAANILANHIMRARVNLKIIYDGSIKDLDLSDINGKTFGNLKVRIYGSYDDMSEGKKHTGEIRKFACVFDTRNPEKSLNEVLDKLEGDEVLREYVKDHRDEIGKEIMKIIEGDMEDEVSDDSEAEEEEEDDEDEFGQNEPNVIFAKALIAQKLVDDGKSTEYIAKILDIEEREVKILLKGNPDYY